MGRRPPCTRLCTSALMKTVLPARERPVTPNRSDGERRPVARSVSVSSAILASSPKLVSFANMPSPKLLRCHVIDRDTGLNLARKPFQHRNIFNVTAENSPENHAPVRYSSRRLQRKSSQVLRSENRHSSGVCSLARHPNKAQAPDLQCSDYVP